MRKLNLINSENPIDLTQLQEIEKRIGVTIPDDYKKFLQITNGGFGRHNFHEKFFIRDFVTLTGKNSLADIFFPVSELFHGSKDWLPFGFDDGDWIFCICLKIDKFGKIYLMRTDEGDCEEDAFIYVCDSFKEFLDGLQIEK